MDTRSVGRRSCWQILFLRRICILFFLWLALSAVSLVVSVASASPLWRVAAEESVEVPAISQETPVYRVQVPLPLSAADSDHIQEAMSLTLQKWQKPSPPSAKVPEQGSHAPVFLLELTAAPDSKESDWGTTTFGVAFDFAKFLTSPKVADCTTVCQIRIPKLSGYINLVALACNTIITGPEVIFSGEMPSQFQGPTEQSIRLSMMEIAEKRSHCPGVVALRMVDDSFGLLELQTDTGLEFVRADALDEFAKTHRIDSQKVLAAPNTPLIYTAAQARHYGWVDRIVGDDGELHQLFGSSRIQPLGSVPDLILRYEIHGPIANNLTERIRRLVSQELSQHDASLPNTEDSWQEKNYTVLLLDIESAGGNLDESLLLADWLLNLDTTRICPVARVHGKVKSDALLIVYACRQIIAAPGTLLGGDGLEAFRSEASQQRVSEFLTGRILPVLGRDCTLCQAGIFPHEDIGLYRNRQTGKLECFPNKEVPTWTDANDWLLVETLQTEGDPSDSVLALSGETLHRIVGSFVQIADSDLNVRQLLGANASIPKRELRHNWITRLLEFLALPWISRACLTLAFLCIFAEIFILPGAAVSGFLSIVFFGLFFWGQILGGTGSMLEVVLFVMGFLCILLEIFVIPGFGIFGVGGFGLMTLAIVMAMQSFWVPQNDYQWTSLENSLWSILGSLLVAVLGLIGLNYCLPKIFAVPSPDGPARSRSRSANAESGGEYDRIPDILGENGLLSDGDAQGLNHSNSDSPHTDSLLGLYGRAVTPLTPAGRIEIAGYFYDVVSNGTFVEQGMMVRVIRVQGTQIVVAPTE